MRRYEDLKGITQIQLVAGAAILISIAIASLFAHALTRYPYDLPHIDSIWSPQSSAFYLGTDSLGRDILCRLIWGSRESLLVAVGALSTTVLIGVLLGFWCAQKRGIAGYLMERIADLLYAFPTVMLALLAGAVLGAGRLSIILAISLGGWPVFFRLTRALVLNLQGMPFVDAARVAGAGQWHILWCHILPNLTSLMIPKMIFKVGDFIMIESTLSFLGVGIQPPIPSWGNMIRDGLPYLRTHPSLVIITSIALAVTVTGFVLLGDGISDLLNPHQQRGIA
jgi:peptide/nickel transport system permease protein